MASPWTVISSQPLPPEAPLPPPTPPPTPKKRNDGWDVVSSSTLDGAPPNPMNGTGDLSLDPGSRHVPPPALPPNPPMNGNDSGGVWDYLSKPFRQGGIGRQLDLMQGPSPRLKPSPKEKDRPDFSTPTVDFTQWTPNPGVARGVSEFASGLTTPQNLAIMGVTGGLGAVETKLGLSAGSLNRLVSLGFSSQMIWDAVRQSPNLVDQVKRGDWDNAKETLTRMTLGTAMAATGVKHAMSSETAPPAITETMRRDAMAPPPPPAREGAPGPQMNRAQRRASAAPPENGLPEGVSRGVDARERLARQYTGKSFTALGNQDRIFIDDLIAKGYTGVDAEPPAPPRAAASGDANSPEWQVVSSAPLPKSAADPTVPEAEGTLGIQLEQLAAGDRRAVMFPKGTPLQKRPAGMKSYQDADGNTFLFNPQLTSQPEIDRAAAENRLPELLGAAEGGMGAPDKSALAGQPVSVVARDAAGETAQGTVTDQAHLARTVAQTRKLTPEGGDVSVEPPSREIAHRMAEAAGGEELTRGTSDIPITDDGRAHAERLGEAFARKGGLDKIYHGPLERTVETAQAIADAHDTAPPLIPVEGLRPWALGALEGVPEKETHGTVDGLMKKQPDTRPGGQGPLSAYPGESHNQFVGELAEAMRPIVADYERDPNQRIGVVTHSRDLRALRGLVDGGFPERVAVDPAALNEPVAGPGQVERLFRDKNGKLRLEKVDIRGDEPLSGGIYIARHGETEWNKGGFEADRLGSDASGRQIAPLQAGAGSRGFQNRAEGSIIDGDATRGRGVDDQGQSGPVLEPREPSYPQGVGKATRVRIPGENRGFEARYAVRELDDVHASHNPFNFERNPNYQHTNDRNYADPKNAERIVKQAKEFDPEFLVSESPDAVNGAPVIDRNGNVLGGNSRTMTLGRVYEQFPEHASRYRLELMRRAGQFGLDTEQIAGMRRPVLVRELAPAEARTQDLITDLNKTGTATLTPAERALADSRRVSPETLDFMQKRIEAQGLDGTLAQALEGPAGAEIVNRLVDDGIVTPQEKPQYTDERGVLTSEGKQRIARLLIGRLFRDTEQFENAAPALRNNLERIVGPMARLQGRPEWDLTEATREAIDAIQESRAHGVNLDDLVSQAGLFGDAPKYSPEAIQIAKKLLEGPRKAGSAFRDYAAEEELSRPGAPATFFEPPAREDAFASAFGAPRVAERVRMDVSRAPKLAGDAPRRYEPGKGDGFHLRFMRMEEHPLDEADARFATAYVSNPSGIEILGRLAGMAKDDAGSGIGGIHLSPEDAHRLAVRARRFMEATEGPPPPELVKLAENADRAYREGKSLVAVVDHDGLADEFRQAALREELDHGLQSRAAGGASAQKHLATTAAGWLQQSKLARQAAHSLQESGYRFKDLGEAASEVGVRLMRPNGYEQLGISRAQARSLGAEYVRTLRQEHGHVRPREIAQRVFDALRNRGGAGQSGALPDGPGPGGRGGPGEGAGPDLSGSRTRPEDTAADQQLRYDLSDNPAADARQTPAVDLNRNFLKDEAGTSRVGEMLRSNVQEMRALKAKRDAALEELEKSKTTPAEKRFGEKVVQYFTGERDLWSARVNQAVDKLRRLVPHHVDQEALSLMREFANRPGEMERFLDGTHIALAQLEGKDFQTAMTRIAQLRPAIERALNPTPAMLQANEVLTNIADVTLREGQRLGILESRWTPQEYVTHMLHPKGEGDLPVPAADRIARKMGGKIGKYFAYAERRGDIYPTLLHAVADNVNPKTLNALDAFTLHADKFATARATNLLENQLADTRVGMYGVKRTAPEGWVPLAPHADEFRRTVSATDVQTGETQSAEQRLFVPKFVEEALRGITDPDYTGFIPWFRKTRVFQAYMKQVQLGLSLFHAVTENQMAVWNMGPTGWARALRADRDSVEFIRAERDMIAHGGTSSIQGKTVEAYQSLQPGSIPRWSDIWRKFLPIKAVDKVAQALTDFTFGNLQRKFKVMDYSFKTAAWMAKHPQATAGELNTAKQSVAKEINAVYGGLHWENLGVNRAAVEVARAVMLAPDWTLSNIFNVKYAFERGTPAGQAARMFWARNIGVGIAATQAFSLLLTGKPSKRLTQVCTGTDSDGNDIYQNWFFKGASGDWSNFVNNAADYGVVEGTARSLAGKAAPLLRTGLQLATNRNYLGQPIVAKGDGIVRGTLKGAAAAAQSLAPVPLSVGNLKDMLVGPDAGKYTPLEYVSTIFAGNPPQHVAPENARKWMRSSLEQGMSDYFSASMPRYGKISERNRVKGNITKLVRAGRTDDALKLAQDATDAGKITDDDVEHSIDRAQGTALIADFKRLPLNVALDLIGSASAEEREQVLPLLGDKLDREFERKPPNEQKQILHQLQELKLLRPEDARQ